jgi:hypothetical protein
MSEIRAIPEGATCVQCGATVTAKVVELGGRVDRGGFNYTEIDRLTLNLPCGHDALAIIGEAT